MPHHYVLHRLNVHPKYHHVKKHLSHFNKSHPKMRGKGHYNHPSHLTHNEQYAVARYAIGSGSRVFPPDPGMHTLGAGVHRKKLHPLKFKC